MIGGNTNLIIKTLENDTQNYDSYGKRVGSYANVASLYGYLDLSNGDSRYTYNAKIEDSTHIFICDYENLSNVDIENSKAYINDKEYDIDYIDDPMGLHEHLEIYLSVIGGQ